VRLAGDSEWFIVRETTSCGGAQKCEETYRCRRMPLGDHTPRFDSGNLIGADAVQHF